MRLALPTFACVALLARPAFAGEALAGYPPTPPDGGAAPAPAPAVDRDGANRLARKALGRIKDGAWDEATELLRQANRKDPRNAAIATDFGFCLAHLGRRDEAERMYRSAIDADPNRFYAYVNLAELWTSDPTRWQRRDDMLAFLDRGLTNLAGDARAHAHVELRLTELLRSLGRTAEARARLGRLAAAGNPPQVRRRAAQLLDELDAETRDRALEDWPAPAVTAEDRERLAQAQAAPNARAALQILDPLVARWPSWAEVRWERGRLLERLGQLDDAAADLAIVVQLLPSHAQAWRHLGILLGQHGGRFEAERADEALRHALALEPSWSDLRELRNQVAAKRAHGSRKPAGERAPEPTAKARQLLQEAQSWIGMEAPELAPPLLRQALDESPAFVEAAASLYAIEHVVPEATIKALWNDGQGLWQLVVAIGALRSRETAALARPWLNRAVELGVEEARFARASLRAAAGERAAALEDLREYVAAEATPPRLEEALALRLTLMAPVLGDSPERLVHWRLAADRPDQALAALGGGCRTGLPFDSLLAVGRVHEYQGEARNALACYRQALAEAGEASDRLRRAWERMAAATTALPAVELGPFESSLVAAAQAKVPLASFALARLAEGRRQWEAAAEHARSFLAQVDTDEPRVAEARALQARIAKVMEDEAEQRKLRAERIRAAAAIVALLVLAALVVRRRYRQPLARALRTQPLLFPALAKAVGQIRHDVLKHRASALELLADAGTQREDVARALLEPKPASADVASIYEQLAQDARAVGVRLCPLPKEPVVGPLAADLARAEAAVQRPDSDVEARLALRAIDERIRGQHGDRLQTLLRSGPRTAVDTRLLSRWTDAVLADFERAGRVAPRPELEATDASLPLPEATLCAIVGNLVRNALEAVAGQPGAAVAVRVEQGRDGTGRRTVTVRVADSSPRSLDAATIENRPADRGLGIVRETTRTWGGELVVQAEGAPYRKSVGVRFAAPPERTP